MKQVFFLLLIGIVIGVVIHSNMFALSNALHLPVLQNTQSVQGVSTTALPKDFAFIQKEIAKLPVTQISTASPQIQGVIHLLQKLPKNQIKMICQNMCSGIK